MAAPNSKRRASNGAVVRFTVFAGALALTIYTLAPALSKEQLGGLPLLHLSHAGPGNSGLTPKP
jgi:hypothetical protein